MGGWNGNLGNSFNDKGLKEKGRKKELASSYLPRDENPGKLYHGVFLNRISSPKIYSKV